MIVNKIKRGLSIINHESHGLLAGKIAFEISDEYRPQYFFESLIAVTEHDDRQLDFDEKDYLSENGIPLDFTDASTNVNNIVERMNRIISESKTKSGWVRLLVSYHLEFLYSNLENDSKKIKAFFKNERTNRNSILNLYNITENQAKSDYEFLRFCDRLSLILCKDEVPSDGRKLEINKSINNRTYFICKNDKDELNVEPWIFTNDEFKLFIEVRHLELTHFESAQKFENKLKSALPTLQSWTFRKN